MKVKFAQLVLGIQKIDRRYIQLAFALVALVLLVIGAGAPEDGGTPFR